LGKSSLVREARASCAQKGERMPGDVVLYE
jgi:hypothetical protein